MRLERLALLALFACNTDIGVTEAENSAPTISATLLGGPFRPGDEVTVQATADDQEDPWDLLQVSIDVPEATLEGPIEVAGGGQWTWTFEAIPDLESISVTAIDRQEASATETLPFELLPNTAPTVTIDSPTADARIALGNTVIVEVSITDPDQALSDLDLEWSGLPDLSAAPANPDSSGFATFAATGLDEGSYTLSLTATDDALDSVTRLRSFTIVDPDADGDGDLAIEFGGTDCDDSEAAVNGSGVEICDGLDNDCNGTPDDDATDAPAWYTDSDTDGFGDPDTAVYACNAPADTIATPGDCDDGASAINPNATEVCDGVDNNCSGVADEGFATSEWFYDFDGDGYGAGTPVLSCISPGPDWVEVAGDCDDNLGAVNPSVTEVCDGVDNNCSGTADEGFPVVDWFYDFDGDDYGAGSPVSSCFSPGPEWVDVGGDCDDDVFAVNPAAQEVCDDIDNNCAGGVDEGLPTTDYFYDGDGDGYGAGTAVAECEDPGANWSLVDGDCNDNSNGESPGGTEVCGDGLDNDCVGGDESCGADYSGYWQVRDARDDSTVDYSCFDGRLAFNFGRMLIDHNQPSITLVALEANNSESPFVNGCEPPSALNPNPVCPGLVGAFVNGGSSDFAASSSVLPDLDVGFREYYNLVDSTGDLGSYATFTDENNFEGGLSITFEEGQSIYCGVLGDCSVPPDCQDTVIPIYGVRE